MKLEPDQRARPLGRLVSGLARSLSLLLPAVVVVVLVGWLAGDVNGWSKWLSWVPAPALLILPATALLLSPSLPRGRFRAVVRWSLVAQTVLLLAWTFFVDWGFARSKPVLPEDIVLVHWNATWPAKELKLLPAYEAITAVDADLVVITEPGRFGWSKIGEDFTGRWPHVTRSAGILILSREPVRRVRPVIASDGIKLVLVQLDMGGSERVLWVVDLPSDPGLSRPAIFSRLRTLAAEQGTPEPDLLVGDLNVTRHSRSLAAAFPQLVSCFDEAGAGWSGTWPRELPLWQLDQTMISPMFECRRFEVLDPGYGRHMMPCAALRPRSAPDSP